MIHMLLNAFAPLLPTQLMPVIDLVHQRPRSKKRKLTIEAIKTVSDHAFSLQDSFGAGKDIHFEHTKKYTKITYHVPDINPLFHEPERTPRIKFEFPDGQLGIVPEQFILDFVRSRDVAHAKTIPVLMSEPYLCANGKPISWHHPSDINASECRDEKEIYRAPALLIKLRMLLGNDLERFTFLTYILTQTPFNDMYKTIAGQIHDRHQAIVLNGRAEASDDDLERPRFRGYEIKVIKENDRTRYKVIAMIAGYFSACSIPSRMELIERKAGREIGWYCCKIEYDLDERTAIAQHKFVLNEENLENKFIDSSSSI